MPRKKRPKQNNFNQARDPVTGAFVSKAKLLEASSDAVAGQTGAEPSPASSEGSIGPPGASGAILDDYRWVANNLPRLGERPGLVSLRVLMREDPKSFWSAYREMERDDRGRLSEAVASLGVAPGPSGVFGLGGEGGVACPEVVVSSEIDERAEQASPGFDGDDGGGRAFRLLEELIAEYKAGVK